LSSLPQVRRMPQHFVFFSQQFEQVVGEHCWLCAMLVPEASRLMDATLKNKSNSFKAGFIKGTFNRRSSMTAHAAAKATPQLLACEVRPAEGGGRDPSNWLWI
jgi:hypothetical protein